MRAVLVLALLAGCTATPDAPVDTDPPSTARCEPPDTLVPDARLVRWPYLTHVTTERATISFGLPPGVVAHVEYGDGDTFGATAETTSTPVDGLVEPVQLHHVDLEGLNADAVVCYRIVLDDGSDLTGPLRLRTAPPADTTRTIRFLVTGDFGSGLGMASAVYDQMRLHWDDVDFWLTTGDNAYPQGSARDWQDRIFVFYQELLRRQPFFPTPGNHDYGTGTLDPYLQSLVLPDDALKPEDDERYYGFDWGPVHFSMLDSERAVDEVTPEPGDDMVDWFTDDLADAADRPWRVAAWHHPAYLTDPARRAKDAVLERLVPAAEAGGAQLVLQGHSHVYERFDHLAGGEKVAEGTSYVVTGGGGAPLDEVTEDDDHVEDTDLAADLALRDFGQSVNHFMIFEVDRCRLVGRAIDLDGHEFDRVERTRSAPECAGR